MNGADPVSLQWVSKDLGDTVQDARQALEEYVERGRNRRSLAQCRERLHVVHGVLRMVEIYGAALLTEEMEKVIAYLLDGGLALKNEDDALEALTRAMVQLPSYLERVTSGGRDIALVLLPLLNDLRAVRGHPLLSEGTLLLLNVGGGRQQGERPAAPRLESSGKVDVVQATRLLRPRYQLGLLGWIKGQSVDKNLKVLSEVALRLERAAATDDYRRLWWVEGGVLEALCDGGLETSVSLKRLLGQVDRVMKAVIDGGEKAVDTRAVDELVNNLLYYVARATSNGKRIAALRESFNLEDLLPPESLVEQARESLSGPSVKLMKTVAAAIKEDLSKVKDVLDIHVRTGKGTLDDLRPQLEMLKKISDTLGVLGLGSLRGNIQQRVEQLDAFVTGEAQLDEETLEQIAATLLHVEDTIDEQLLRMIRPAAENPVEDGEDDVDYRQVTEAVLRECVLNMARIKEAITSAIAHPGDSKAMDSVPGLFRGVNAALLMLNRSRVVAVMERIGREFRAGLNKGVLDWPASLLDRLADAIVSVEYYLETVKAGRADPFYMLDNAEASLDALARQRKELEKKAAPRVSAIAPDTVEQAKTIVLGKGPAVQQPAASSYDALKTTEGRPDPEILELFIEEAKEELREIGPLIQRFETDPGDEEATSRMRRAFHTLKGSGRVVGAEAIAEFSWAVENMLNRIIDGTLARSSAVLEVLHGAKDLLPELIEQLEVGTPPPSDVARLASRAQEIAEGRDEFARAQQQREAEEAGTSTAVPLGDTMDPVLKEIFTKETAGHLETIKDYLEEARQHQPPYRITSELHRSCHTLSGSANMAGVLAGVAVAEPWNRYVRKLFDAGYGLSAAALDACGDVVAAVEQIVEHLDNGQVDAGQFSELVARIGQLDASFEKDMAEQEAAEAEQAPAEESKSVEPEPEDTEFDPEIAAIYSEEAAELLESLEAAFSSWSSNWNDDEAVAHMRRYLHTLKGGARMAGIGAMGDLSHELETLLIKVSGGEVATGPALAGTFQHGFDELHRMREVVSGGRRVTRARDLVERIRQVAGGQLPEEAAQPEEREPKQAAEVPSLEPTATEPLVFGASESEQAVEELPEQAEPGPEMESEPSPQADLGRVPERTEPAAASERRELAETAAVDRQEFARVDTELLDELLNNAGEISIFRARLEQQVKSIDFNVQELSQTVTRLKDQLRKLEIETEAQILHRHQQDLEGDPDFDPLEMDRYSLIQQLSRALAETASDVDSIKSLIQTLTRDADTLLVQQGRVASSLQDGLMRTRMVPFSRYVTRLSRVVRQISQETGNRADLRVEGANSELDRQVVEKMLPCLEHLLRNAVIHGIESPTVRSRAGKSELGTLTVRLRREGSEVIIDVGDDGRGLNLEAIREKAVEKGMARRDQVLTKEQAVQLVFEPGFSTAGSLTQSAGRGVGMDVVATQVRNLGGSISVKTEPGRGTIISTRLPFTLAISQAMVVRVADELFALPLPSVEGVVRIPRSELEQKLGLGEESRLDYGGHAYRFQHLAQFVGLTPSPLPEEDPSVPLILIRAGDRSSALIADEMLGSREIVVKSVGPQLSKIEGVAGATILGDGRIALILDAPSLLRSRPVSPMSLPSVEAVSEDHRTFVMVVDDSITVRRVTQRLLERNGMRVITAKDGVDALALLQDHLPDVLLLDIEMPRMDGYELAANVRNDPRLSVIPIIMITSRVGQKHRARAIELGVDDYLGKPYQESQLLDAIDQLMNHGRTNVY